MSKRRNRRSDGGRDGKLTLLVIRDQSLSDGLADSVQLSNTTTAGHADAQVDVCEALAAEDQDRFVGLLADAGGLQKLDGLAIDFDDTLAFFAVRDGHRVFLAAEHLDGLNLAHCECLTNENKQQTIDCEMASA